MVRPETMKVNVDKGKEEMLVKTLEKRAEELKYSRALVNLISELLRADRSQRIPLEVIQSKLQKEYGEWVVIFLLIFFYL